MTGARLSPLEQAVMRIVPRGGAVLMCRIAQTDNLHLRTIVAGPFLEDSASRYGLLPPRLNGAGTPVVNVFAIGRDRVAVWPQCSVL
jgi:hypothetical protein